jgi:hypothetical protein
MVASNIAPGLSTDAEPEPDVTVCVIGPLLVHRTVLPTGIVSADGLNTSDVVALTSNVRAVGVVGGGVVGVVGGGGTIGTGALSPQPLAPSHSTASNSPPLCALSKVRM